ncbi:MAG: sensor histidine kinase, partial [Acidimicrobiia bacterium]
VADNGPGVPDVAVEQIFEHFEQLSKGDARSSSGIGLGLPIARRLARAMGGDVWYERRFPTGSRFCFSLPLTPGEKAADGSVAPVPETMEPRRPAGLGVVTE